MHHFGELLRVLRRRHNLSIRQLAAIVRVDHAHLSRIERGQANPSHHLVERLAHVLNAPELFRAAGYLPPPPPEPLKASAKQLLIKFSEHEGTGSPADPMLPYLLHSKNVEEMDYVFRNAEEYKALWLPLALGEEKLGLIPPLRREIAVVDLHLPSSRTEGGVPFERDKGYKEGFTDGVDRAVAVLREIFHEHPDGSYWLLAAVSVPPEKARVLADVLDELRSLGCDPKAAGAVLAVLRAWPRGADAGSGRPGCGGEGGGAARR